MTRKHPLLSGEEWCDALAGNFNGLVPDLADRAELGPGQRQPGAVGWLSYAQLGPVAAFHVAGSTQVLRRSPARARQQPCDLLKVCIQRAGLATIAQGDREVVLAPGSMAIYDIDKPYAIALQGRWRCSVIAFPRSALIAPDRFVADLICRPAPVSTGPGSVLAPLIAAAITASESGERTNLSGPLMGRASLDLLKAALAERGRSDRPDAVRLQIDSYLRANLADPALSHRTVAAAHHMSERTLHRLFDSTGQSVTDLIRTYRLEGILADLRSPQSADETISRIASRWGLHDMPHLTRSFRTRYGISPSEARKSPHFD